MVTAVKPDTGADRISVEAMQKLQAQKQEKASGVSGRSPTHVPLPTPLTPYLNLSPQRVSDPCRDAPYGSPLPDQLSIKITVLTCSDPCSDAVLLWF